MSYTFITDPVSKNVYSIHSELGRNLLKSYISQVGGNEEELPENDEDTQVDTSVENVDISVENVENNTPAKVEDKSWARFKSQWLIWIGDRFKEMGDLFNSVGNSQNTVEEQSGGNGNEYVKQVLTFNNY
mgnify:CR=1 FL=1